MKNNQIIGLILLVVAVILLYFGMNAANSPMEEIVESLTGQYSDRTVQYFIGAGIAAAAGVFALLKK